MILRFLIYIYIYICVLPQEVASLYGFWWFVLGTCGCLDVCVPESRPRYWYSVSPRRMLDVLGACAPWVPPGISGAGDPMQVISARCSQPDGPDVLSEVMPTNLF